MGKIAFVFPGQGAQAPGMGRSLCEYSAAARELFEVAEGIRPGTMEQCFSGPAETLSRTVNTQPCLFLADMAAAVVAQETDVVPEGVAGFSLGEMAALCFAGALEFSDAFRLVMRRAECMQRCADAHPGAMLAVLKLEAGALEALCTEFEDACPVNYNAPGQIVVSLPAPAADAFSGRVRALGGRAMRLKVNGAFHTPWMRPATAELSAALTSVEMTAPDMPVYANRTGLPYPGPDKRLLADQISSPIRFEDTIRNMLRDGFDTFVETGPGRVLSGLIQKIDASARVLRVSEAADVEKITEELSHGDR